MAEQRTAYCTRCPHHARTRKDEPPDCAECGSDMMFTGRSAGRPKLTAAELLRKQAAELLELADELE